MRQSRKVRPIKQNAFIFTLMLIIICGAAAALANEAYRIGSDDVLEIRFWQDETLDATVTVTDNDNDQIVDSQTASTSLSLTISDTDPTLTVTGNPSFDALSVTEATGVADVVDITAPTYTASAVDGYSTEFTYALNTGTSRLSGNLGRKRNPNQKMWPGIGSK